MSPWSCSASTRAVTPVPVLIGWSSVRRDKALAADGGAGDGP
ncbi:hypothetical protein [Streptomyces sp. NPDC048584]